MGSKAFIFFISLLFLGIVFNRASAWKEGYALQWDKAGYYVYLPATFIYKDLGHLSFYREITKKYGLVKEDPLPCYGCHEQPATGKVLNKYPLGIAIAELPFFLLAHAIVTCTPQGIPDGFSSCYQLMVLLATIFWSVLGIWNLRSILKRYFPNDSVVMLTLLGIAMGTNLYYYTAFDGGMSHAFSFAFFAIALNQADLFYASGKSWHLYLAAIFTGWIIIARPANIAFCLLLVLWQTGSYEDFKLRFRLFSSRLSAVAMSLMLFLTVILIQLAYWKYTTGQWIHYSYEGEGFKLTSPRIYKGLFSYRKGWFIYTPLAIISLAGLPALRRLFPRMPLMIAVYLAINCYIVFSWGQWSYGGGFGARALVESLVVIAFPLAALLQKALARPRPFRQLIISLLFFCVLLNLWQSYQFSRGIIPPDSNTRDYYWSTFFQLENDGLVWPPKPLEN